jgi:hypothetical protein
MPEYRIKTGSKLFLEYKGVKIYHGYEGSNQLHSYYTTDPHDDQEPELYIPFVYDHEEILKSRIDDGIIQPWDGLPARSEDPKFKDEHVGALLGDVLSSGATLMLWETKDGHVAHLSLGGFRTTETCDDLAILMLRLKNAIVLNCG